VMGNDRISGLGFKYLLVIYCK